MYFGSDFRSLQMVHTVSTKNVAARNLVPVLTKKLEDDGSLNATSLEMHQLLPVRDGASWLHTLILKTCSTVCPASRYCAARCKHSSRPQVKTSTWILQASFLISCLMCLSFQPMVSKKTYALVSPPMQRFWEDCRVPDCC